MPPVRSTQPARAPRTETATVKASVPRQRKTQRVPAQRKPAPPDPAPVDEKLVDETLVDQTLPDPEFVVSETEPAADHRWQSRPLAARLVQLAVLAVPVGASVVCAAVVS